MTRHEPSLIGVLLALLFLPVVALVYYLGRLGEWVTRGKGVKG